MPLGCKNFSLGGKKRFQIKFCNKIRLRKMANVDGFADRPYLRLKCKISFQNFWKRLGVVVLFYLIIKNTCILRKKVLLLT